MKDTLISFETAKLARDKGFMNDVHMGKVNLPSNFYTLEINGYPAGTLNHVHVGIPAPTQSLLQKWLRETHGLHVGIPYLWAYKILDIKKDRYDDDLGHSIISYATYEDALEQGLVNALNMIP